MDMREDADMTTAQESPESRLLTAGFTRRLEWWVPPGSEQPMTLDDAIRALDNGEIEPAGVIAFPDTGVRAFPDELVDRICPPAEPQETPTPPRWLLAQAQVIAEATVEKLKPLIRAEVRAALRAEARKQARETAT